MDDDFDFYKSITHLVGAIFCVVLCIFLTHFFFDYLLNARANLKPYYNLTGNPLLPNQVIPYRFFAGLSMILCFFGSLISIFGFALIMAALVNQTKQHFYRRNE